MGLLKTVLALFYHIVASVILGPVLAFLWNHSVRYVLDLHLMSSAEGICVVLLLFLIKFIFQLRIIVYDDLGTRITDQRPNVRVIGEQETPTKKTKK